MGKKNKRKKQEENIIHFNSFDSVELTEEESLIYFTQCEIYNKDDEETNTVISIEKIEIFNGSDKLVSLKSEFQKLKKFVKDYFRERRIYPEKKIEKSLAQIKNLSDFDNIWHVYSEKKEAIWSDWSHAFSEKFFTEHAERLKIELKRYLMIPEKYLPAFYEYIRMLEKMIKKEEEV